MLVLLVVVAVAAAAALRYMMPAKKTTSEERLKIDCSCEPSRSLDMTRRSSLRPRRAAVKRASSGAHSHGQRAGQAAVGGRVLASRRLACAARPSGRAAAS
jgi:hypothetical protein